MDKVIQFLDTLDRRWVFLTIAIAVVLPVLGGWTFPEKASPLVKSIYDHIEKMPEGSKVLFACDYDPGSEPELQPMATAVARHLTERNHKIYFIALWPVGPRMIDNTVREVITLNPAKILDEAAAQVESKPKRLERVRSDLFKAGFAKLSPKDRAAYTGFPDLAAKVEDEGEEALSAEEKAAYAAFPGLQENLLLAGEADLPEADIKLYEALRIAFYLGVEHAEEMDMHIDDVADELGVDTRMLQKLADQAKVRSEEDASLKKLAEDTWQGVLNRSHPEMVYGEDYVNLGFKSGMEGVIIVIATDLKKLYTTDHNGTDINDIPMTKEIVSIQEVDLIISISAGYAGTKEWVQYAAQPYDIDIAAGNTGVQAPLMYPYIPRPLFGIMGAIKGAAEYEALLREGYPKFEAERLHRGVERMGPQMIAHLAILLLIIVGNITFFATREKRRAGGEG